MVFSSEGGKWNAVLTEIKRMHKTGRPVLVGTTSVERSEQLAELLQEAEIKYQVGGLAVAGQRARSLASQLAGSAYGRVTVSFDAGSMTCAHSRC